MTRERYWWCAGLAVGLGFSIQACDGGAPAADGVEEGLGGTAVGSGGTSLGTGGATAGTGGSASGGATTGGTTGAGGTSPRADGYELVWADEFEGASVDTTKWEHEVNCWGGGNAELQCYVADEKNSYLEEGMLHIVALEDAPSGAIGGPGNDGTIVTREYSSARLRTANKAEFKYGRFEARIRVPFGQGLWPAFWMLPTGATYGGWAKSGEIDILEAVNASPESNEVHGTLHYGDSWPGNVHTGAAYSPPAFIGTNFYTYAVEWEEGEIRWFVDDVHYATQNDWYSVGSDFPAPFDKDFHLLLNVAVGGNWPGPPNAETTFPQEMTVDFVRVYRCAAAPDTGIGCGTKDPSVTPL